jgi:hypothetical protein
MNFKNFLEHTHNNNEGKKKIQKKQISYQKIIPKLPPQKNILSSQCLLIDSRHRNKNMFPNTNHFAISFNPDPSNIGGSINTNIKNIIKINIENIVLPTVALDHPYIILKIDEINNKHLFSSDGFSDDAFAILIPKKFTPGASWVNCHIQHKCQTFKTPLANLKKLTIRFYDPNRNLMDFGADHVDTIKNEVQTMIMLNVEYYERDNGFKSQLI